MNNIFGLNNNGNTCYQNAALQALFCISKFTDYITNKKLLIKIIQNYKNETNSLNDIFLSLVFLLFLEEDDKIKNPSIISKCIKDYKIKYKDNITTPFKNEFPKYEQLDSYDYINAILTILHKELKCNFILNQDEIFKLKDDAENYYNDINNNDIDYNKQNILNYSSKQLKKIIYEGYSIINKIFSGQYINISECENCGFKNFSFTLSDTLDLDLFNNENHIIFNNLYDCLDNQMNINLYSDNNHHKQKTGHLRCYSYYKIFYPPSVLIIRLKRFNDKSKINNPIDIPLSLNINKYIHMFSKKDNENYNYELCSAVIHLGNLGGGHYISIGKKNNMWLEFNDSSVSIINNSNINNYLNKSYILFYQRI